MRYSVRELDASSHQGVLQLWRDTLNAEGDFDHKLAWFYQEAPAGPGTVLVLHDEQGAPVGAVGRGSRLWYVRGKACVAALYADFAIARAHRTLLPAMALQRESRRRARMAFPLSYGFPNQMAVGVFERVGFHKLGKVCRFTRILHHAKYVRRLLKLGLAGAAIGRPLDWLTGLPRAPRMVSSRLRNRLEWPSHADERFDRLALQATSRFPIIGDRSARFLNWRFRDRPGHRFDLVALCRRGNPELVAYAVIEQKDGVASLRDLLAVDDRDLRAFLDLLASALADRGCDSMSFASLGGRHMVESLKASAFHERPSNRQLVVDAGESWTWDSALLSDTENWHVTDADEDI